MKIKGFVVIAAAAVAVSLAGCGGADNGVTATTTSAATPTAADPAGFQEDALSLSRALTDAGFLCIPNGQTNTGKASIASCTFLSDSADGIDVSILVWPTADSATSGIDAMLRVAVDSTASDPSYGPGKNFVQGPNWLLSLGHNMVAAGQVVGQFGGSGVRVKRGEIIQF